MKSILQKIKEEFFYEPLKYFMHRRHKKKSSLIIFLHFNQCYSDFFETAWEICYKPIFDIMKKFDNVKFIINLSGSFLENVNEDAEKKNIVKNLMNSKNIRLSGSFKTQHISGTLNKDIEEILIEDGKQNDVFWLPERSYSMRFLQLIEKKGYHFVFLENFYRKGMKFLKIGNLRLFPDEIYTRYIIDGFFLTGRNLFKMKNHICTKELTVFAEDAEVIGLWNYEKGISPEASINRFAYFLKWISCKNSVNTIFPEEFTRDFNDMDKDETIEDYFAQWIEDSFRGKINQYYENGYKDFRHFLKSDKITFFREKIEDYFKRITSNSKMPEFLKERLLNMLWINVYEFGCPGIGFEDRYLWAGILKIEKYISVFEKDYNMDFSQGIKAVRKIKSIFIDDKIFFIDEFAQIIAFIDIKNKYFLSSEYKIFVDSLFDSEYPALFFESTSYLSFEIKKSDNTVKLKNSIYEFEYSISNNILNYKIINNSSQKLHIKINKYKTEHIYACSSVYGEFNLHMQ